MKLANHPRLFNAVATAVYVAALVVLALDLLVWRPH